MTALAAEVTIDDTVRDATYQFTSSPRVVFVDDLNGYIFYIDSTTDVTYRKTSDGGANWGDPVVVGSDLGWIDVSIWYERWTPGNTTGTKIYLAAAETVTDDIWFNFVDTSDDSTRGGGWIATILGANYGSYFGAPSIIESTDGTLYINGPTTTSPYQYIYSSSDGGDTWEDTGLALTYPHYRDKTQLLPLSDGDVLMLYYDYSAGLYYYEYDAGTSLWSARTPLDTSAMTAGYQYLPSFGATIKKDTNDLFLSVTTTPNVAGNDIRTYTFTDSTRTWSGLTDVLTDATEAGQSIMLIDENTSDLYVAYINGSSWGATTDVWYVTSSDGGSSWGSPVQLNSTTDDIRFLLSNFSSDERLYVGWLNDDLNDVLGNTVVDLTPSEGGGGGSSTGSLMQNIIFFFFGF